MMIPKAKFKSSQESKSIYEIAINYINGLPLDLTSYKGKKLLFVNVASRCGFTPQYRELQKLFETYRDTLMVIAVPCNQFGAQEPGSAKDIQEFCEINYGIEFVITEKVDVKGVNQHPLYQWLTKASLNGKKNSSVKWNFQKYLVDEEGRLIDVFYSITKPMSKKITKLL